MITQSKHKWWIFFGTGLMIMLANIDATIVNLSLPAIAKNLHASLTQMQWVINSYLLSAVVFFIAGGRLADMFGRRKVFLIGTLFFTVASCFAGIAVTQWLLIGARILQGIGFALTLGLALVINAQAFPSNKLGLVVGWTIAISGVSQALGPTLGGVILSIANWHWIFLINIPFGILSMVLIYLYCEKDTPNSKEKLDIGGFFLMGIGFVLFVTALNQVSQWGLSSPLFLVTLTTGLLAMLAFYFKERRTEHPLVDFTLFDHRAYFYINIVRFCFMYSFVVMMFCMPIMMQNILGYSAFKTGLILLFMTGMIALASPITGKLMDKVGFKGPTTIGIISGIAAITTLLIWTQLHHPGLIYLALFFFGLCAGMCIPSTVNAAMSSLPNSQKAVGMGAFFTIAFFSATLSIAVSGSLLGMLSASYVSSVAPILHLSATQLSLLKQVSSGAHALSYMHNNFPASQLQMLDSLVLKAFSHAFAWVLSVSVLGLFVALVACFKLENQQQEPTMD